MQTQATEKKYGECILNYISCLTAGLTKKSR